MKSIRSVRQALFVVLVLSIPFELYAQESSAKALLDSGNKQFKEGNFVDAIAYYTGAIQADAQFAKAYTRRGSAKRNRGDAAGALQDLNKAIELDPKDAEAYYNRGLIAVARRDAPAGLENLDRAVELDPKNSQAIYARGVAKGIKGDNAGAIADYGRAIELDSKNIEAVQARGKTKMLMNDLDGAIADFTKVLQIARNPESYFERGAAKAAKGDHDGAISDFGQLISADPDDVPPRLRRGISKADKRDLKGALSDLQKALELRSSDEIQLRVWLVRSQLGDRQPATKDLAAFIEKRKADTLVPPGVSIARFLTGQLAEAELVKIADTSFDTDLGKEIQCQIYFYLGAARLLEKDTAGATDRFQKSMGTGRIRMAEYASAAAELRVLQGKK